MERSVWDAKQLEAGLRVYGAYSVDGREAEAQNFVPRDANVLGQ